MKITFLTLLLSILASAVFAAAPQKPVIVSYPDDTPDSVLEEAKNAIKAAGGFITHEYRLIKAFAAKATETSLEKVSSLGKKYNALIEEDDLVHTADAGDS